MLAMDMPEGIGDRLDAEQAVLAPFLEDSGCAAAQALTVDAAIHHDMGDMDAERAIFARHALGDHAQPRLGRGEMGKARLAAEARRGAGEEDGAASPGHEPARRLAPDKESAEAAHPPEILELRRRRLAEI